MQSRNLPFTYLFSFLLLIWYCQTGIAQICNCTEFIYLNEPSIGAVLKFEIDPNQVLLTEVMGDNGGTTPTEHWYPGTGTSELPSPHGLAMDLNGSLYIGSSFLNNTPIRKIDCDGNISPIDGTTITNPYILTNMFSIDNTLYTTRSGGAASFDLCTGTELGTICFNDNTGTQLPFANTGSPNNVNWGLTYNSNLEMVYATGQGTARQGVWVFTKTELETGIQGGACIDPLIWRSTTVDFASLSPGDAFLPNNMDILNGIVSDNDGNIYVTGSFINGSGFVLKYTSNGEFIASTSLNSAVQLTRGIVWSEGTNKLYIANQTDIATVDCISVFDASTMAYLGAGAPNPNLPDNNSAKALSILKECCPTPSTQTIDQTLCEATVGHKLFLNKIFRNYSGTQKQSH